MSFEIGYNSAGKLGMVYLIDPTHRLDLSARKVGNQSFLFIHLNGEEKIKFEKGLQDIVKETKGSKVDLEKMRYCLHYLSNKITFSDKDLKVIQKEYNRLEQEIKNLENQNKPSFFRNLVSKLVS